MTRACFLLLLLLWARVVFGTDNYSYKDDEYAVISGGPSPDGHWSIAAHGDGEAGYENFDLYLMREPGHEKLAPLHTRDCLDTGPLSIIAIWAPDSKHVAVLHRSDRHVLDMRLFAVADGKARAMGVPLLVKVVGRRHLKRGLHYEFSSRLYCVEWQQADRLALAEQDTLDASKPVFGAGLEDYLTLDRVGSERTFTTFSGSAIFEITAKEELHLASVKPLLLRNWPETMLYSPHLRVDPERGLYSTETTMSSLDAQKSGK